MLTPLITLFVDPSNKDNNEKIMAALEKERLSYQLCYEGDTMYYLQSYNTAPHRFYFFKKSVYFVEHELHCCDWERLKTLQWVEPAFQIPSLAIKYAPNDRISENDWVIVDRYFKSLLLTIELPAKLCTRRARELLNK